MSIVLQLEVRGAVGNNQTAAQTKTMWMATKTQHPRGGNVRLRGDKRARNPRCRLIRILTVKQSCLIQTNHPKVSEYHCIVKHCSVRRRLSVLCPWMMTGPTPHKVVCLSFIDEKGFRERGGGYRILIQMKLGKRQRRGCTCKMNFFSA